MWTGWRGSMLRAFCALTLPACSAAGELPAGAGGDTPSESVHGGIEAQRPLVPSCPGAPVVTKLVTGGGTSVLALLQGDARVWCWGECKPWKQLGYPNVVVPYPAPLEGMEAERAVDVCGGRDFGCALLEDGRVWCWGRNTVGELGNGEVGEHEHAAPGPVAGVADAVQVVCGWEHACVRKADGTVWCWGHPGGFRDPTPWYENAQPFAAQLEEPGLVVDLVTGGYHTCAVLEDGRFACSGFAANPVVGLQMFEPIPYVELSAGARDTCALRVDGGVSCFTPLPTHGNAVALERIAEVGAPLRDIWLTGGFACGLTANSEVLCSRRGSSSPLWAPVAPDVREIDGLAPPHRLGQGNANGFACAVGRCVQCWGDNVLGQLGDGTTQDSYDPVMVHWGGP